MKTIELSEQEVETLKEWINYELDDKFVTSNSFKTIINNVLKKLKDG